jgi:hypothetical protein
MNIDMSAIWKGMVTGVVLVIALAVWDRWASGAPAFGLATAVVGVVAGGLLLVAGFVMALVSYGLAQRNRAPLLRRRLLTGAIWAGGAGMSLGLSAAVVWLAAGQPWFP